MDGYKERFLDSFKKFESHRSTTYDVLHDGVMALEATFQQEVIYIPSAL